MRGAPDDPSLPVRLLSRGWLSHAGPGFIGGKYATPQPVPRSSWADAAGDLGEDEDVEQGVVFLQESHRVTTAEAAAGLVRMELTHEPIEHSEHLYWGPAGGMGVYQPGSVWHRDGQTVVAASTALAAGDRLTVEYAYIEGLTLPAPAVTLVGLPLVGWFSADYELANQSLGPITTWTNLAEGWSSLPMTGNATLEATTGPGGGPSIHLANQTLQLGNAAAPGSWRSTAGAEGFFVRKRDSSAAGSNHNFGLHSSADLYYPTGAGLVRDDFSSNVLVDFTPTMSLTEWRRYNARASTTHRAVYLDEVLQGELTGSFTVGGPSGNNELGASGGNAHNGRYSCVLLFSRVLTDTERAQVIDYLAAFPCGGLP